MAIPTQQLRAESHTDVGAVIERDAGILIERWVRRAEQEQPKAARVHHAVLLDSLPQFLQQMGRTLAAADEHHNGHRTLAREHGEQRWESGWSLEEVVRDYQILRIVILEYLLEALDRPLTAHEAMAVGLVLDEAIAASISRYHSFQKEAEQKRIARETADEKRHLIQESELLRETQRHTDEFLAVLGHELRNPLAPLLNALHLLRLRGEDSAVREQVRALAERQVHQLARLVDDLLDLSRIRQGKITLKRERIDLCVVVRRAVETARPVVAARHHELEVELPPGPIHLEADPGRIEQVIVNLLNNAAKFTENGGRIRVLIEHGTDDVAVRVKDNGIGLSPEAVQRIFNLYTQVEQARDLAGGGLGIGLSLVKGMVELHGGTVRAMSDGPGRGSEFVFCLPLRC